MVFLEMSTKFKCKGEIHWSGIASLSRPCILFRGLREAGVQGRAGFHRHKWADVICRRWFPGETVVDCLAPQGFYWRGADTDWMFT